MDLILRNLRLVEGAAEVETDVGIAEGRIAAIGPGLSTEAAVQRLAPPLMAFKNGRRSFTRQPPQLHCP